MAAYFAAEVTLIEITLANYSLNTQLTLYGLVLIGIRNEELLNSGIYGYSLWLKYLIKFGF